MKAPFEWSQGMDFVLQLGSCLGFRRIRQAFESTAQYRQLKLDVRIRTLGLLAAVVLAAFATGSGCAHPSYCGSEKPVCYPSGPCSGFFPTCWRRWPDECAACPVEVPRKPEQPSAAEETEPLFSPPGTREERNELLMPGADSPTPSRDDAGRAPIESAPSRRPMSPEPNEESRIWGRRMTSHFAYSPNEGPAEASVSDE